MLRIVVSLFTCSLWLLGSGACGDDDASAVDASPPDTTSIDGTSGPDPNWSFQNCVDDPPSADAAREDAGEAADGGTEDAVEAADAGADAAPESDGGPTTDGGGEDRWPGLDEACCDPTGTCQGDLVCLISRDDMTHQCRPRCDVNGGPDQCPQPSRCLQFEDGRGVCLPAGLDGDACAPQYCADGLLCVGSNADNAFCRQCCTDSSMCNEGETCLALPAAPATCPMACVPP